MKKSGMAVNVIGWIGQRIVDALPVGRTTK